MHKTSNHSNRICGKELLLVQCQSSLALELPRAYWAWDLMTDTLILASSDKRTDKRHRGWDEEADSQTLWGEADCH